MGGAKVTPTTRGWGLDIEMAAIRSQLRALANDRNLRRFVVQARPTGRQLGTGSYGTVEEVWGEVYIIVCGMTDSRIVIDQSERASVCWKEDS